MKKLQINSITLSSDRYGTREELFKQVGQLLNLLFENDYVCKIREEDCGLIVIEFEHDDEKEYWGSPTLEWVKPECSQNN